MPQETFTLERLFALRRAYDRSPVAVCPRDRLMAVTVQGAHSAAMPQPNDGNDEGTTDNAQKRTDKGVTENIFAETAMLRSCGTDALVVAPQGAINAARASGPCHPPD